jgi:Protein of unknown function (DUF3558)
VTAAGRTLVLAAAGTALLAGCASSTAGQPVAGPASTRPTPTDLEFTNAELCELLTAGEATGLGGSAAGRPQYGLSTGHPLCQWNADTSLNIDFGKDTRSSQAPTGAGITNTPTEVAGLTAVLSHKTGTREFCQVIVDVTATDTMAFGAGLHDGGRGRFEPCDVARRLADIVIPKIKRS